MAEEESSVLEIKLAKYGRVYSCTSLLMDKAMPCAQFPVFLIGRRNRDRTCDLCLVRAALSQLSYPPDFSRSRQIFWMLSTPQRSVNQESCIVLARFSQELPASVRRLLRTTRWPLNDGICCAGSTQCGLFSTVTHPHAYRFASSLYRHVPTSPGRTANQPLLAADVWQRNVATYEARESWRFRPAVHAPEAISRRPAW